MTLEEEIKQKIKKSCPALNERQIDRIVKETIEEYKAQ